MAMARNCIDNNKPIEHDWKLQVRGLSHSAIKRPYRIFKLPTIRFNMGITYGPGSQYFCLNHGPSYSAWAHLMLAPLYFAVSVRDHCSTVIAAILTICAVFFLYIRIIATPIVQGVTFDVDKKVLLFPAPDTPSPPSGVKKVSRLKDNGIAMPDVRYSDSRRHPLRRMLPLNGVENIIAASLPL